MSTSGASRKVFNLPRQLGLFLPDGLQNLIAQQANALCSRQRSAAQVRAHNRRCMVQPFVMKWHHTKKHHLDFRLGMLDIMFSWAIYGWPSYCPWQFCKAVEVGDHLTANMGFEGVHPEGKVGAGPTMPIDRGVWTPLPQYVDIESNLRKGRLKFRLEGKWMQGTWALTRQQPSIRDRNPIWHLSKERDAFAVTNRATGWVFPENPPSVDSGRTMTQMVKEWYTPKNKRRQGESLFPI
jgi:bifunctional non-homologous end joining protein LigD